MVASGVRQVVVLYSNDCMEICLGGLSIQGVIFLGGGSTKKCDHDCDQALIKSSWGSL